LIIHHDVSPETITCLLEFVEFISLLPESSKWKENFQEYLKKEACWKEAVIKIKNYKEKILRERE